jgi:hypothetical protein
MTKFQDELKVAAKAYASALFDYSFSIDKSDSPRDLVNKLDDIRMNEWHKLELLIKRAVDKNPLESLAYSLPYDYGRRLNNVLLGEKE